MRLKSCLTGLAIINKGRVIARGTPREIRSRLNATHTVIIKTSQTDLSDFEVYGKTLRAGTGVRVLTSQEKVTRPLLSVCEKTWRSPFGHPVWRTSLSVKLARVRNLNLRQNVRAIAALVWLEGVLPISDIPFSLVNFIVSPLTILFFIYVFAGPGKNRLCHRRRVDCSYSGKLHRTLKRRRPSCA